MNKVFTKENFYSFFIKYLPILIVFLFYIEDLSINSNLICLFAFFGYIQLLKFNSNTKLKDNIYELILAILIALMYVIGMAIFRHLDNYNYSVLYSNALNNIINIYGFTFVIYNILLFIESKFLSISIKKIDDIKKAKITFFIVFLLLVVSWLPYYIAFYPGLLSSDSFSQIYQTQGIFPVSNHHPLAHTLVIKVFMSLGNMFGSLSIGVALFSAFQLIVMALCFSYSIAYIYKESGSIKFIIISTLFFSLNPMFGFYSVTMWKDVLFACMALLLMIRLYDYDIKNNKSITAKIILFILVMLVSLFRSNGIFITFVISIVMFIKNKKLFKENIILFLLPLIICSIITGPIYNMIGVKKANFAETAGIPLRQISGDVATGKDIDSKYIESIEKFVPIDVIKKNYNIESIDPIKFDPSFDNDYFNNHKGEFLILWSKMLVNDPLTFVDVYLKSTYGFWFIEANGYGGHIWVMDENYVNLNTRNVSKAESIFKYYLEYSDKPIIRYLLKPTTYLLILMFICMLVIKNKKYNRIIPLLVPILAWATIMIATPVNYQVRYVFTLFTTIPFIIFVGLNCFDNKSKKVKKNEKK